MRDGSLLAEWCHGRFQVYAVNDGYYLRDWLMPEGRTIRSSDLENLPTPDRQKEWFVSGLVAGALGSALDTIAAAPRHREDALFWQYPGRTEAAAWELHADNLNPKRIGNEIHVYLGLPWATWIDKARKKLWGKTGKHAIERQWRFIHVRLQGLHAATRAAGLTLRVHTVCQHIYWADLLARWENIGVTDLWLSHCPSVDNSLTRTTLSLHPWRLFAVNVEDQSRRRGLDVGRDPAHKKLLASFVGAHAPHYISDIRLRLRDLATEPDVHIEVTSNWHLEGIVYETQLLGMTDDKTDSSESTEKYNRILSDSVFSLCPSGAGANTLRLWESLATGSIPVLLGVWPNLPELPRESTVQWDDALIRCTEEGFPFLLSKLRATSLIERRTRQLNCMRLFEILKAIPCF